MFSITRRPVTLLSAPASPVTNSTMVSTSAVLAGTTGALLTPSQQTPTTLQMSTLAGASTAVADAGLGALLASTSLQDAKQVVYLNSMTASPLERVMAQIPRATSLPSLDRQGEREEFSLVVPLHKSLRHALGLPKQPTSAATRKQPKIVGHRGALYDAMENTRPAFLRCVELNCDAVELDVFAIADGSLVVFHGAGSDAMPGDVSQHCLNGEGSILDLTYEQCQKLKFNPELEEEFPCPKRAIASAEIPLLRDVLLDLKGSGLQVKIEIKAPNTVKPVLELVESLEMVDQCCYSSFHHEWLRELRDMRPDGTQYPTGALFETAVPENYLQLALDCGATEVHLPYNRCTADRVREIREAGLGSMAWFRGPVGMSEDTRCNYWDVGNEDQRCYQALFDTGVDQVCLNRPHVAMKMVQQESYLQGGMVKSAA